MVIYVVICYNRSQSWSIFQSAKTLMCDVEASIPHILRSSEAGKCGFPLHVVADLFLPFYLLSNNSHM